MSETQSDDFRPPSGPHLTVRIRKLPRAVWSYIKDRSFRMEGQRRVVVPFEFDLWLFRFGTEELRGLLVDVEVDRDGKPLPMFEQFQVMTSSYPILSEWWMEKVFDLENGAKIVSEIADEVFSQNAITEAEKKTSRSPIGGPEANKTTDEPTPTAADATQESG